MKDPYLLHVFSPTRYVSPFDINMAYEAHYDAVIPYCNVTLDEIHPLTQDTIFFAQPGRRETHRDFYRWPRFSSRHRHAERLARRDGAAVCGVGAVGLEVGEREALPLSLLSAVRSSPPSPPSPPLPFPFFFEVHTA